MKALDLTGQRFGRLEVISLLDKRKNRARIWLCKCDCGSLHEVTTDGLRGSHIKSCGCLINDTIKLIGHKNRHEYGSSSFNTLYTKYKYQATKRGKKFELTKEQFKILTIGNCHYCGKEPTQESRATARCYGNYIYNGIDRVDNSDGYTLENCVTCCEICNKAKRDLTVEEFRDWTDRLHEYRCKTQW